MRATLYLPGRDKLLFRRLFQLRARRFYWERLISSPADRARLRARRSECRIRARVSSFVLKPQISQIDGVTTGSGSDRVNARYYLDCLKDMRPGRYRSWY